MDDIHDPEYLTTEQLAARWHTTPKGVLQLRHRGVLPPDYRIGRRVLYRSADVCEWERRRRDDTKTA